MPITLIVLFIAGGLLRATHFRERAWMRVRVRRAFYKWRRA